MRAARSISGDWTALGLQWDGNLDGTVFAIAVDKNAPSSRAYLANTAHDAVVGQAKNRSPLHLLTRFRTRPHDMFRLEVPKVKEVPIGGRLQAFSSGDDRQ